MMFKSVDEVTEYVGQHKPPPGTKWAQADYCIAGKYACSLMAVEKWPVDDRDIVIIDPTEARSDNDRR